MKLPDNRIKDINYFRSQDSRLENLTDEQLFLLYREYSLTFSAGWLIVNKERTKNFIEWSFYSPFEKAKKHY